MESKDWKKFVKSGTFRRNVQKYLAVEATPDSDERVVQPCPTEAAGSRTDSFDLLTPIPPAASYSGSTDATFSSELFEHGYEDPQEEYCGSDSESDYYSPDEGVDTIGVVNEADETDLTSFMQDWSIEFKISHSALKPLLGRLTQYDRMLPTDPRRLLETPRKPAAIKQIQGGQYWHQGLENCLRRTFANLSNSRLISLNINIDGLPLFKNGTDQVWPILANVFEEPAIKPMIIGMFHGKSKPKYVEEYLTPFVDEAIPILNNGIIINEHILRVKIRAFICDTPARAFIKGAVNFNSFHGCLVCTVVGERQKDLHTTTFPTKIEPKRTDAGFRNRLYEGHHQMYRVREEGKIKKVFVETPLLRLPVDLIEDFVVSDSLHLLHLGATKKLLTLYKDGQMFHKKWPPVIVAAIDKILSTIKLPVEIHRQVRGLNYLTHWKASECASFLNYIGIAVLKDFLDKEHFENFTNLFCAVTICSHDCYKQYLPVAEMLFKNFVENFESFFKTVSSNQHNLIHVVDEVRKFGPLDTISSYPFENYLFQIKNLVRSGNLPLNQIINRIAEKQHQHCNENETVNYPVLQYSSKQDNLKFLSIIIHDGLTLKNSFADKWFLTKQKKVIAMVYASSEGINGTELQKTDIHFDQPFKSTNLNVFCTKHDDVFCPAKLYHLTEIFCKLVAIPVNGKTIFVPLHHTIEILVTNSKH